MTASLALAFAGGLGLGLAYVAMLWRSLRRLAAAPSPPAAVVATSALRVALVVAGLFWLAGGHVMQLLAALAGFTCVRVVATRRASRHDASPVGR